MATRRQRGIKDLEIEAQPALTFHTMSGSILAHRHDVLDDHDSQTGSSKPSCLKSCDDGSRALVKQLVGLDLNDAGGTFTVVNWAAVTPQAPWLSLQSNDLPPRSAGPPIRHRFLRLTL